MQRERLAGVDGELKEKLERRLERCDELRQRRPEAPELYGGHTSAYAPRCMWSPRRSRKRRMWYENDAFGGSCAVLWW